MWTDAVVEELVGLQCVSLYIDKQWHAVGVGNGRLSGFRASDARNAQQGEQRQQVAGKHWLNRHLPGTVDRRGSP